MMDATEFGPALGLFDANGKPRAVLCEDKDGPGLQLSDENSNSRATLTASKDGPRLAMKDTQGKTILIAP